MDRTSETVSQYASSLIPLSKCFSQELLTVIKILKWKFTLKTQEEHKICCEISLLLNVALKVDNTHTHTQIDVFTRF